MGKPKFSKFASGGSRIYYFDVYEDKKGSPFVCISEIPTDRDKGSKKRHRIFVHSDHLEGFREALNAAAEHIRDASATDMGAGESDSNVTKS